MHIESKILNGLERISETLKALLWEQAKVYGISPVQIQILLFVSNHRPDLCNVSYIAKNFNITKATVSDAVKILLKKEFLEKDFSPLDNRRFNMTITAKGSETVSQLSNYALPLTEELSSFQEPELFEMFQTISKLIFQLNQKGIIQVQRTCFNCHHYKGDRNKRHFCNLLNQKLRSQEIRLDCNEYEDKPTG